MVVVVVAGGEGSSSYVLGLLRSISLHFSPLQDRMARIEPTVPYQAAQCQDVTVIMW